MNGCAKAALVCAFIAPLLGVILGIVALNQIEGTGQDGRERAIAGIIISLGWIVLFIIVFSVAG